MSKRLSLLTGDQVDRLRAQSFTYPEVGSSRGDLPLGYHHLKRARTVGTGRSTFDRVAGGILGWQMQTGAGLRVAASDLTIGPDTVAVVRMGLGPASLRIPVRVVYVVDEPDRRGFAYGTLPGHPENGEEVFLAHLVNDEVIVTVTAFSRSAGLMMRAAGPIGRAAQGVMAGRYLDAVS